LVARLFSAVGPKITVIKKPNNVKITMMEAEYETAFLIPSTFVLLRLIKKLTVTGIIEKTHGVINASKPPAKPAKNIHHKDFVATLPPLFACFYSYTALFPSGKT
jgi:hypothetical protein